MWACMCVSVCVYVCLCVCAPWSSCVCLGVWVRGSVFECEWFMCLYCVWVCICVSLSVSGFCGCVSLSVSDFVGVCICESVSVCVRMRRGG